MGTASALGESAIAFFGPSSVRLERLGDWFGAEYGPLLRFAYFLTGDRAAAEDLVQEAFVRIYRAGPKVDEEGFRAYARRTLVNLNRSAFRRLVRERRWISGRSEREATDPPDAGARDEVWRAILALPPRMRACVALRFYEDMTEQQVASTLDLSVGTVKKQIHRAMEKLRTSLGDRREP
jgi:RNA polymerase sigma-70 factor (sigma-E family)